MTLSDCNLDHMHTCGFTTGVPLGTAGCGRRKLSDQTDSTGTGTGTAQHGTAQQHKRVIELVRAVEVEQLQALQSKAVAAAAV